MEHNKTLQQEYSPLPSSSTIRVIGGRGLAPKDPNGRSDPYCRIGVSSSSLSSFQDETKCVRSETVFWTLQPSWKKAVFEFDDAQTVYVRIEVWDRDSDKLDDFMGYANIQIDPRAEYSEKWMTLLSRSPEDGLISGEICVRGKHADTQRDSKPAITVTSTSTAVTMSSSTTTVQVIEGRNLAAKNSNGLSDPYCIIGAPSPSGEFANPEKCTKSEIKYHTLAPAWDKAIYSIEAEQVLRIRVEVWDKDFVKADNFMGYTIIEVDPYVEYSDQWITLKSSSDADSCISGDIRVLISRKFFHKATEENKENNMVRVFLSSTFLDMHEEREHIMHYTMVELDRFCYERGVSLTYIDMRWGITDEMGSNAQTILRCLQEVDNSRPYFVAMLGERYGWHQEVDGKDALLTRTFDNAELFPEYSWIKEYRTSSVTELEILHGFLLHSHLPQNHVFCYFRDPSYIDTLENTKKPKFQDTSPYAIRKLKELKETIKNKKQDIVQRDYYHPEEIGKLLLEDLKASIARDFPEPKKGEDKGKQEHINYAHQRCISYVPRESYFRAIDDSISGEKGNYLLVTGISGTGKSSLLANWWRRKETKKTSSRPIFAHFVGASSYASNFQTMLIRLFEEINAILKTHGGEPLEVPTDESQIIQNISQFLHTVSRKGGITILFDAINQLPEKYHDLHWLPDSLPPSIDVIISSIPGFLSTKFVQQREMKLLDVMPLDGDEKEQVIKSQLRLYGKAITTENMSKLVQHELGHIPLFLKTILSEMCIIGYYDKFQSQFDAFLGSKDLPSLFKAVISRWEESFGEVLVKEILLLILCSRFGIAESHIQQIIAAKPLDLFPCMSAIKPMLTIHHGCLNFGHDYLRKAVLSQYPRDDQLAIIAKLVDFWKLKPFDEQVALEYPWLLSQSLELSQDPQFQERTFRQLYETIVPLDNFEVFNKTLDLRPQLVKYWNLLKSYDSEEYHMGRMYQEQASLYLSTSFAQHSNLLPILSLTAFLTFAGYHNESQSILLETVDKLVLPPKTGYTRHIVELFGKLGDTYLTQRNYTKAIDMFTLTLETAEEIEDDPLIADAHYRLSKTTQDTDTEASIEHLNEALSIHVNLYGDMHFDVGRDYNELGNALRKQRNWTEAINNFNKSIHIFTKLLGETNVITVMVLNNVGTLYGTQGEYHKAQEYFNQALVVFINLYGTLHPNVSATLNNIGNCFLQLGEYEKAHEHYSKAIDIYNTLYGENHPKTQRTVASLQECIRKMQH